MTSDKTIGRLCLYRRLLKELAAKGETHVYSHALAALARCSPAQVRRDVMTVGYSGTPAKGYEILQLMESIGEFLDAKEGERVVVVGVGNLGRALLAHFTARSSGFNLVAGFDTDPERVNRVICGCRCYPLEQLETVIGRERVEVGVITVPPEAAQETARRLCSAGVRALVNFAPVRVWVPGGVYVENVDLVTTLERAAFFAKEAATARA